MLDPTHHSPPVTHHPSLTTPEIGLISQIEARMASPSQLATLNWWASKHDTGSLETGVVTNNDKDCDFEYAIER